MAVSVVKDVSFFMARRLQKGKNLSLYHNTRLSKTRAAKFNATLLKDTELVLWSTIYKWLYKKPKAVKSIVLDAQITSALHANDA